MTSIKSDQETSTFLVNSKTSVLLQTATGIVLDDKEKRSLPVKILFDSGSQRTYLSERLVKQLNLKPINKQTLNVKTFGDDSEKTMDLNEYSFCIRNFDGDCSNYLRGLAVPLICAPLSGQCIEVVRDQFPMLKSLNLADKGRGESEIDILVGADFYWDIVDGEVKRCSSNGATILKLKLGWLLSGPYDSSKVSDCSMNLAVIHALKVSMESEKEVESLSRKVDRFWDLDTIGIAKKETSVHEKFVDDIQLRDNRYEVKLPFKEDLHLMEDKDNFTMSLNRLEQLKRKLDKDSNLLKEYNDVIQSQLSLYVIEKVEYVGEVGTVTYLPHRAVIRDDKKSTKVRVVFDASAKNKGLSLNECLYKGPCLSPLLYDVLLKFRVHSIGITADIEKAYLQISVDPQDRDYLKFLWYDDILKSHPEIIKYRFTHVYIWCKLFTILTKWHRQNSCREI